MTSNTTYICDQCKKPTGELYGPMFLEIRNQDLKQIASADLCSWDCAVTWMQELARETKWTG